MSDHIYKMIELTGSSETGIEDAVQNAIVKSALTVHGMRWFQVMETRVISSMGRWPIGR